MRRYIFAAIFAAAVVSCGQPKTRLEANLDNYAVVHLEVPASINDISDNGKEVLNLYRFAADEADKIFWDQNFGDKALMDSLPEPARDFAMVNYGPWNRITGKPFVKGYGDRPFGSNFYPEDMTEAEFEAFADPAKNSPYTMIRRDEAGKLVAIPYHEAYKEHVDKIYNYLVTAADITIKPSVRNYLLKKAEALRTDDYYESELAWLDMNDSKMDLVIGPNEKDDDEYRGLKASYGAVVMLKDTLHTAMLSRYADMAPELQAMLPCDEKYKSFVPGSDNNIFACDVLYYAGNYNAGFKVIAINLPYDPRVQAERGTRTIIFNNVIREKFNRTVFPVGQLLLESSQKAHLDVDAFYWNIAFREVAHGLGVKQTLDGRDVVDVLGADAYTLEEAKANILGVYLAKRLGEEPRIVNAIEAHHNDVEPVCIESILVQIADAISAARPGARRETLDNYIKRLENLEEIAVSFEGVDKAFAIQAGRELRILVNADTVTDDGAKEIAKGIAGRIEAELRYPGRIKVTIIREMRAVEYAR